MCLIFGRCVKYVRVYHLSKTVMPKSPPTSFWCRRNGPRKKLPQHINVFWRGGKWEPALRTGPGKCRLREDRTCLDDTGKIPPYRPPWISKLTLRATWQRSRKQLIKDVDAFNSPRSLYHLKLTLSTTICR